MSFDDGSLGRRGERTGSRGQRRTGLRGRLADASERLRTHLREWPGRYVEMRTSAHERK